MTKSRKSQMLTVKVLALIWVVIFSFVSCDAIFGPKEDEEFQANIVIYNEYGESLDIYIDGVLKATIEFESNTTVENISQGEHNLEAKKNSDQTLVESWVTDITSPGDYIWTIGDPPDIDVTNNYGETLKIYMDGIYQFTIANNENRWILDVDLGDHSLVAKKDSDDSVASTETISVTKTVDYAWTIAAD